MRIEEVTAGKPGEERTEFTCCKFMDIEHRDVPSHECAYGMGIPHLNRPKRNTQGENHINLKIRIPIECIRITQSPFSAGMCIRYASDRKPLASAYRCNSLLDFLSFGEHHFTICRPHIVQIDIDGQTWQIEYKQIQRRAALQDDSVFEEWVTSKCVQQTDQADHLVQGFQRKSGCCRFGSEFP